MGEYLQRWVTDAPKFARETSDWFIDRPLTNVDEVVAGCRQRLQLLDKVDVDTLTAEQRERLNYFRGLETFIADFHRTHAVFQRSQQLLQAGDLPGARAAMAECHPEPVIEQFAKFSSLGGITRGEQGLVVSLNTRWLSHLVRHRQALGLEPVRLNFAPTSHDPLAQSPGKFTFHFDADRGVWECLGAKETGADTFVLPADTKLTRAEDVPAAWEEIGRTGVESGQPIRWTMRPIMARDSRNRSGPASLPPGKYRLRLLLADPSSTAPGQRVFDVSVASRLGVGGVHVRAGARTSFFASFARELGERLEQPRRGAPGSRSRRTAARPAVSANAAVDGYPAGAVLDGDPEHPLGRAAGPVAAIPPRARCRAQEHRTAMVCCGKSGRRVSRCRFPTTDSAGAR